MNQFRILHIPNMTNLRDLGGYQTTHGTITRYGRIFRSDTLSNMDPDALASFIESNHITAVIDLRRETEANEHSYVLPQGCVYHNIPYWYNIADDKQRKSHVDFSKYTVSQFYMAMVSHGWDKTVPIMHIIANTLSKGNSVLFHCTFGKDRTGIIASMLLRLVDCYESDIMTDYMISFPLIHKDELEPLMDNTEENRFQRSDAINMFELMEYYDAINLKQAMLDHGLDQQDLNTIVNELTASLD